MIKIGLSNGFVETLEGLVRVKRYTMSNLVN